MRYLCQSASAIICSHNGQVSPYRIPLACPLTYGTALSMGKIMICPAHPETTSSDSRKWKTDREEEASTVDMNAEYPLPLPRLGEEGSIIGLERVGNPYTITRLTFAGFFAAADVTDLSIRCPIFI